MNRNLIERLEGRICFDAVYPDANFDGQIDTADFTVFACNFGQTKRADVAHGDFTQDQVTNALDFNVLASQFGETMANRTFGGILSTDINAPGTNAWLVAQPTSIDTGVLNSSLWTNPPGSDSGANRTWGGLDLSAFGENTTVFDKIAVSGVLALGTSQVAGTATFRDVGTVTGTCSAFAALAISSLTGTVSGSNVASDGTLVVSGGNGTVEADNTTASYTLDGFVGTAHANSNKTCSFAASGTLSPLLTLSGTGTNSVLTNLIQDRTSGQQAKAATVTGGVEQSHAAGSTYSGTYVTTFGFTPTELSIGTSSFSAVGGVWTATISSDTEPGSGIPVVLYDATHAIGINLDTITVTAAPTADISGDGIIGHVQGGSYANFTPTSATVGGVAMTGFSANAGTWTATLGATTPTGSQAAVLNPGAVAAGNITVVAALTGTPSQNRLGIGLGLGL